MDGQNTSLISDPVRFLSGTPVNVSEILTREVSAAASEPLISKIKYGMFDLASGPGQAWFKEVSRTAGAGAGADAALIGYWCPFNQGNGAAGFVDVPKTKPVADFVFTAAMNGCALMVLQSPVSRDQFRLVHHQHPEVKKGRAAVNTATGITDQAIVFEFTEAEYDSPPTTGSFYQCFNFLRFEGTKWKLYSQYTKLAITRQGQTTVSTASLDLTRDVIVKDVPMP